MSTVSSITASSYAASVTTSTDVTLSEADVVDSAYEAALAPAYALETQISANETQIAAYQDMQGLLQSLEDSLSSMSDATDTSTDVFAQRSAALSTSSTDATVEMSATVAAGTATGTHQIVVEQVATAERIASGEFSSTTAALDYSGSFYLSEADGTSAAISITSGMSLSDIEAAINDQSSATGVDASILEVSSSEYMLVLTAQDTNQAIEISGISGSTNVAESLGLVDSSGSYADELQAAQPAILKVDGVDDIERDTNDISDILPGVTFDLTQADPNTTVTMNITYDTGSIESAIEDFVTAYNNWRDFVIQNDAVTSDGTASSSATLFGDGTLRDVDEAIQDALSSMVDGEALATFGISFNSENELTIDAATLESALQDNVTALQTLFDFQATTSSSELSLTSHGNSSYSGSFALDIQTDGSGNITGVSVDGNSSLFTVTGDTITGNSGTAYAGLTFYYDGTSSAIVNVSISQGIGAQIYQITDSYSNTLTGTLQDMITSLESQDSDDQSEVNDIVANADDYKTYLLDLYGTLEAQIAESNTTTELLKTLIAYDTASG
jgi:flagellar hook-associated protein 2